MIAHNDDGQQSTDLDDGEQGSERDGFQNAPRRDRGQRRDDDDGNDPLRKIDKLLDITGRSERHGRR